MNTIISRTWLDRLAIRISKNEQPYTLHEKPMIFFSEKSFPPQTLKLQKAIDLELGRQRNEIEINRKRKYRI